MFFSLNAFNSSAVSNKVIITNKTYNNVSLNGGHAVFDGVHLKNRQLNDSEILDISSQEVYGTDTIFLANFEDNLEAGNYTGISKPITKWRIRRKKIGSFIPKLLNDVNVSVVVYTDYLQANRTDYEYQVSPISDDGTEGSPIASIVQSDFFGWFLCSLDNKTVYKFDMNVESDSISLVTDSKLFEGFTQYPVTRIGKRKYHSGGLKTMPYHFSLGGIMEWYAVPYATGGIAIDNGLLKEIEKFISNGEPKLLKNTSGDLFKIQTSDFSYQYMDIYHEQPFTISFKWTEVGDAEQ